VTFSSETLPSVVGSLDQAYEACSRLAAAHYENFPVASRWLPRDIRPSVAAVYAFARCADDFADELGWSSDQRLSRLGDWRRRLNSCTEHHDGHPVFWALSDVFSRTGLPLLPFSKLITAFEWDVTKTRHATFDDVLLYCTHSANPVGEIVLRLFNAWTPQRGAWSDAVCTALQLANFWQDVSVDAQKDRLYVPLDEVSSFGLTPSQIFLGPVNPVLRDLMALQVRRTKTFFTEGRPLCDEAPPALKKELRFVWLGGTEILHKIERQNFDVWSRRPALAKWDWIRLLIPWVFWRSAR